MDFSEIEAQGITPLMLAANGTGNGDAIKKLLSDGADVNAQDRNGQTALMYATFNDSTDAAEALLSVPGIGLEVKDITGSTALMKAVAYKAVSVCRLLIGAGAEVNCANYFGETALIRSIINRVSETTELLLQAGADVNLCDNTGRTPLIVAACYNDTKIVKQLIRAGSDTRLRDKAGNDAALAAAGKDSPDVLAFLLQAKLLAEKDTEAALIKAAMNGFADSTATILSLCKDPVRLSYAALVAASLKDKPDLVPVCMDFHCDINGRIYFGMTPLMIASYCNAAKTAARLISYGANVNLTDEDGFTALMYGAMKNNPDIIFHLMRNGADKNIRSREGKCFEDYTKDLDTRTFSQMLADRLRKKLPELAQERADEIPEGHQSFGDRFEWYRKKYFERYPANKNSDIYRGAGITKQTFSKIFSKKTPDSRPKKDTVIALALGLKLTVNECEDLLQCAGYSFLTTDRKDMEARRLFREENYDLFDWNDTMYASTGKIFFRTLVKEDGEP